MDENQKEELAKAHYEETMRGLIKMVTGKEKEPPPWKKVPDDLKLLWRGEGDLGERFPAPATTQWLYASKML